MTNSSTCRNQKTNRLPEEPHLQIISCADGNNVSAAGDFKYRLVATISTSPIFPVIAILIAASPLARPIEPNESGDRAAIEAFTRNFLRAFEDLNIEQFIECFADYATVFFPMPEPAERVEGK
jgi:hypothetical protein